MGYRIVYGPPIRSRERKPAAGVRIRNLIAVFLFLFAVIVRLCWPEGAGMLREYLLPGDLSSVEEAYTVLLDQLRNGEELREAALVFCRSILYEAP